MNSWPRVDGHGMLEVPESPPKRSAPSDMVAIGADDIGKDVWALMPNRDDTVICMTCGSFNRLCGHETQWTSVQLPAVVSGALLSITSDHERAQVLYQIEGEGLVPALAVCRSESEAHSVMRHMFHDEFALLAKWVNL
jgi:hypothetical protein